MSNAQTPRPSLLQEDIDTEIRVSRQGMLAIQTPQSYIAVREPYARLISGPANPNLFSRKTQFLWGS